MNAFEIRKPSVGPEAIPKEYIQKVAGDLLDLEINEVIKKQCYCSVSTFIVLDGEVTVGYHGMLRLMVKMPRFLTTEEVICLLTHHGLVTHHAYVFKNGRLWLMNDWREKYDCTKYEFQKIATGGKQYCSVLIDGVKYNCTSENAEKFGLRDKLDFGRIVRYHGYSFSTDTIKTFIKNCKKYNRYAV